MDFSEWIALQFYTGFEPSHEHRYDICNFSAYKINKSYSLSFVIPGAFFAELCVTASTTAHPEGIEKSYPGNNL
jgi:hypothetical protein